MRSQALVLKASLRLKAIWLKTRVKNANADITSKFGKWIAAKEMPT